MRRARTTSVPRIAAALVAAAGTSTTNADLINWASANSGTWGSAVFWNPSQVPTINDHAIISASDVNSPYSITLDANYIVGALTYSSTNSSLQGSGKTLTVAGQTVLSGGLVSLTSSSIVSDGGMSIAGTVQLNGLSSAGAARLRGNAGISNNGTIELGTTGQFSNQTASSFIEVNNGATLTNNALIDAIPDFGQFGRVRYIRADNINNVGTIRNSDTSNLIIDRAGQSIVSSGIINAASGNISITGAASFFNTSQGSVLGRSVTIHGSDRNTSTWTNDGNIILTGGGLDVRTYDVVSQNGIVDVSGGNTVFNNINTLNLNGTTTVGAGRTGTFSSITNLNVSSATALGGAGNLTFSGIASLNVNGSLNLNGPGTVQLTNTTVNPVAKSTAALSTGADSRISNLTVGPGVGWGNGGAGVLPTGTATTVDGTLNNTGSLTLEAFAGSDSVTTRLTLNGDSSNSGTIAFATNASFTNRFGSTFLNVDNGATLSNEVGGLIDATPHQNPARPASRRYIRADNLVNHGTIRNSDPQFITMDRAGQNLTNTGLMDATAGTFSITSVGSFENAATGVLQGRAFTINGQSTVDSTWSNDGSISLDAGGLTVSVYNQVDNAGAVDVSGGNSVFSSIATMNHSGSIVPGAGRTATLSSITNLNVAPGATIDGPGNVTLSGIANLNIDDSLDIDQAELLTISGVTARAVAKAGGVASFGTGADSRISNLTVGSGVAWTNSGAAVLPSSTTTTVDGALDNTGSLTLEAFAGSNSASTFLTLNGDSSNSGTIAFATNASFTNRFGSTFLNVDNGATLTNETGGLIDATPHQNPARPASRRYIRADNLVNHGAIRNSDPQFVTMDRAGQNLTNTGLMDASAGAFSITSVGSFENTATGVLQGRAFTINGQNTTDCTWSNDGSISLDAGGLGVSTYNQVDNTGSVNVTGGNATFSSIATMNHSGAIVPGAGRTATLSSITNLNVADGAVLDGPGSVTLSSIANLNIGGTLSIDQAELATISNVTAGPIAKSTGLLILGADSRITNLTTNAGLSMLNNGSSVLPTSTASVLNSSFDNNGTLTIEAISGSNSVSTSLTLNSNSRNDGVINLSSSGTSTFRTASTRLIAGNGATMVNGATGLIEATLHGNPSTTRRRYLQADILDNKGVIRNSDLQAFELNTLGQRIDNSGLFDAAGGSFSITGVQSFTNRTAGELAGRTFTIYGANQNASTWQNQGTIELASGGLDVRFYDVLDNTGTVDVSGGNITFNSINTMNHSGAIVPGAGRTANLTAITNLNIGPGAVLGGAGRVSLGSIPNLNIETSLDIPQAEELVLSTVTVKPVAKAGGAASLNTGAPTSLSNATIDAGVTWNNAGVAAVKPNTTSTINGHLNNTGTLAIEALSNTTVNATLNIYADASNSGTISIQTSGAASNRFATANLTVNDGATLTNHASGVIEAAAHTGNVFSPRRRYLRADYLVNHGLIVNQDAQVLNLDRSGSEVLNTGTMLASGGSFDFDGATVTNDTSGVLAGTRTFDFIGSTFVNNGTIAPGTPVVGAKASAEPAFGTLSITGGVNQSATGVIEIEFGDAVQDLLALSSGAGILDGVIRLIFTEPASAPSEDDVLTLVTGSVSGNYAVEIVNLEDGFEFTIDSDNGALTLTALNDGVFVPSPGPAVLIALAAAPLCSRRRRS